MEEKLRELEERVNFLHSLTLRLVRWTNFQDEKELHEAGFRDKEDGGKKTTLEKGRTFRTKEKKAVAKKSTSGIRKKHLQPPVAPTLSPILEDNHMKTETPIPYFLEDSLTEETPFFVKEEPSDDYADFSWPEEIVNNPSPTAEEKDTAPDFRISGYSPNSFQDDSGGDKDFSPSSNNSEDETTSDESSTDDEDYAIKPQPSSSKRRKMPASSSTVRQKAKSIRMKKVVVQPLSSDVKPPFVSLNRIDRVTLKDKYGLSEPKRRTYACPKCGEIFPLIKLMLNHRKTVHSRFAKKDKDGVPIPKERWRNKTYPCEICGNSYPKKKLMKAHQKEAHPELENEKRYKCSFCGRQFRHQNTQRNHEKTHTGEKPHLCYLCGYAAATSTSLSSHMECKHGVDKNRKCDKCQQKFRTRSQLRWHQIKTHRENLPDYPCEYCGAVFLRSHVLKQHVDSVHKGIRNFPCEKCDKKFKGAAELRSHLEKHIVGFKRNRGLKTIKIPAKDDNEDDTTTSSNANQEDPQQKTSTGESQSQAQNETQEYNIHNNETSTAAEIETQKTETEYL